ncbi:MAG: SLC45 family MFS transporter [Lentisphaerae bacterium]|nr:SLC45 family MFS transporter [Lentisphaerota bacterium]
MTVSPEKTRLYTVGSLQYTLLKLCWVSGWVLLGSFWYNMLETVFVPTLLPLNFHALGASGALTGMVLGSIPSGISILLNPVISTVSDRTRTRFGRRMPYILTAVPVMAGCMIMLGWLPVWAAEMNRQITILLYSVTYILMHLANMVIGTVMSYLKPDVIPENFIGRLQAGTLIASSVSGYLFNRLLMQFVPDFMSWIFTGIALAVLLSFTGTALFVREGKYPAPENSETSQKPFRKAAGYILMYLRECFAEPFYLILFCGLSMTMMASVCRMLFCVLFASIEIGIAPETYGVIMSYASLAGAATAAVMFFIIDRSDPLKIFTGTALLIFILDASGYFFARSPATFAVTGVLMIAVYTIQNLSIIPLMVKLLPADRFGQFVSAYVMMCGIVGFIANALCGKVLDIAGYRSLFIFDAVFTLIATLFMLETARRCFIQPQKSKT